MASRRLARAHFRSIAAALAIVLAVSARPDSVSAVVYTNVTASAGINHLQHPGLATGSGLLRTGGAAAGDFDNDGWVDLFVTRLNARPLLYRNRGDGTFQDVAVAAGFTVGLPANGPAWGDIDNDGNKDLYVTSSGGTRFYMYINDGNGHFTEQAVQRGADVSDVGGVSNVFRYGQSVTFGDYDSDGYLDIHTNDWGNDTSVSTSRLLRNLGAANPGYFEDVTAAAGLDVYRASPFYPSDTNTHRHSSTFTDIDRDGHPDLAIASDFQTSQLFWNNGDGTFTDGTLAAGVGSDEDGMGSTIGDFDGDGRLDWFVSALVDIPGQTEDHSGNRLYRNNGDRTFADQTDLGGVRDSGWSWGTTFLDHDNDRDLDLFITNGWPPSTPFDDKSHIYQNDNGVFTDVSAAAGVTDSGQGRGLLSLDYDNDGDLDVFIVNHGAKPILYRNDGGNANDWLKIKIEGTASNRDGIGAFITVDPDANVVGDEIVREINAGSNFLSQNELTAHFGLGPSAGTIDLVTVVWPSGAVQELSNVSANQVLSLVENVMPGDYNGDGNVDAADYVVWRKTGINGQQGYNVWRANVGAMSPPGSSAGVESSEAVPEPSGFLIMTLALGLLLCFKLGGRGSCRAERAAKSRLSRSFALPHDGAPRLSCCALLAFAFAHAPLVSLAAGRQMSLAPIDLLPNSPTTYQMRDWRQVALDFENLAFNTTATGQYLPLMRIDNTYQQPQPQGQTWFGLPAYVGETRTFGETGEPIHEAIASLGAVLSGTLMGVDKTTGPYNWVAMSREYYVDRNSQFVVLNTPFSRSGETAWYEVFPNILLHSIADRYPGQASLQTVLNTIDARFYSAVDKLTVGGTAPNFNYTAYDFKTQQPVNNGIWREPDMGLGMAWLQHAAYRRNRVSNPTQAAAHLNAVDWALAYYETRSTNPNYEVLTSFGAYAAARMNAEHSGNYNVHKYLDWVFSRSAARPDLVMISGEQWGGEDVGGLLGTTRPNTSNPVQGYAFAMNTYANAMPVVALVRYEDRYSRAIGKWMLNAASAARLFYGDAHPPKDQSSEFWTGDPQNSIAYEGLRHHWLPPHLLAPGENQEIYAAGDPLTYDWGPLTDFGIYGSAYTGVLGSVIKTTNVEKILQLDLLATDFYRDAAHKTFLYYNPHPTDQSIAIDLGSGQPYDMYDAAANRFVMRNVTGNTFFNVPKDDAVMLVLVPSGGTQTMVGRKLLVNDVVIDYNATLLPDNLVRNPDVDAAHPNNPNRPSFWHYSSNATWSDDVALSPTHALELLDNSATAAEEWRSYATDVPEGEDRSFQLRWFWKYDVAPGGEFSARLRLSEDQVTSLDLTNPSLELNFTVSGEAADFEMFETAIVLPDGVQSFDLTFISDGALAAMGTIYIDDISASIIAAPELPGDCNGDASVDAADYVVWRKNGGTQQEHDAWRAQFGATAGSGSLSNATIAEPASGLLLILWAAAGSRWRHRFASCVSSTQLASETRQQPTVVTHLFWGTTSGAAEAGDVAYRSRWNIADAI